MDIIVGLLAIILDIVWWIIIVQAVMSWLIAFNVINTYNETVRSIWLALKRMTDPIYAPIRRVMPDTGALDLSPLVVLLIIMILRNTVLPALAGG